MNGKRRERPPDQPRAAGEILVKVLEELGLSQKLREREALTQWPEVVGPEVARRSRALRIREGVLYVRVDSAVWRQELHFLKSAILMSYQEKLGPDRVKEIRFTEH
jgi:predicted nucleic acid-binding Zn ribbon protein